MEHLLTFPNALSLIGTAAWLTGSKLVSDGKVFGWWLSLASLVPAAVLACMAGAPVGLLGTAVGTYLTVRAIRNWSRKAAAAGRTSPRRVSILLGVDFHLGRNVPCERATIHAGD